MLACTRLFIQPTGTPIQHTSKRHCLTCPVEHLRTYICTLHNTHASMIIAGFCTANKTHLPLHAQVHPIWLGVRHPQHTA